MPSTNTFMMFIYLTFSAEEIQFIRSQDVMLPPSSSSRRREIRVLNESPNLPRFLNRVYTSCRIVIVFLLITEHSYLRKYLFFLG